MPKFYFDLTKARNSLEKGGETPYTPNTSLFVALDVALVRAARQAAGPDVALMVDGGWYGIAYDDPFRPRALKDWIALVEALEDLDERDVAAVLLLPAGLDWDDIGRRTAEVYRVAVEGGPVNGGQ